MKPFLFTLLFYGLSIHYFAQNTVSQGTPSLYYLFKEPKIKSSNPPVIILMHGIGSNEKDLFSFASQLPDSFLIISLRAPIILSNDSYAWYHLNYEKGKPISNKIEAEQSRKLIIEFINQLNNKHAYDNKRVYLCGFSQGSIMTYSVGLTTPDKIKGIAILSGRLLEDIKPKIASKENLKRLRVFISHGSNDGVINVSSAREANTYLKKLGINPTYQEYPEDHTISNAMFNDLLLWLKK
jgi:phospholipase/carboxylesterase